MNSDNCSTVKIPTITAPFTPRSAYSLGFAGVSNPRYETGKLTVSVHMKLRTAPAIKEEARWAGR